MAQVAPRSGQVLGSTGLIAGGLLAVYGAAPHNIALLRIGWAFVALGVVALVLSTPWRGDYWWRTLWRRWKRRPQLYLSTVPVGTEPDRWKGYWASWSPSHDFGIVFSNHAPSQIAIGQELPAKESGIVLHLFNAGPDDVRHVRVQWSLPDFDVVETIKRTALFDPHIAKLSEHGIELVCTAHAARRPFHNPESVTIPILKAHETVPVQSPEAFTGVFSVACLALAKEIKENAACAVTPQGSLNPFEQMARAEREMPSVFVKIEYSLADESRVTQSFDLIGCSILSGFIRKTGTDPVYEQVPDSLCGGILNLQVIPHEK